jgi:gliding motility-associated-like protein
MESISSGHAESYNNTQDMVLYFSAEEEAHITVTVNNTAWSKSYYVPAHSVIKSDVLPKGMDASEIDCRLYDGLSSEGAFRRHGVHIVSDVPVVAYAHGIAAGTSGATMLMPVETWGYSYLAVNTNQLGPSGSRSWAFVIASHDNTAVEITPAVPTRGGRSAGVPFIVTLNKGDIYQVMGAQATGTEMSGSRFRAVANVAGQCYPVALFCGSSGTVNPMKCSVGQSVYFEADIQQVFPIHAWGRRYLTTPTSNADIPARFMSNGYKVLVNDLSTIVKLNGTVLNNLVNNYYYFESSTADLIEADKPVMVAQFIGSGVICSAGGGDTDPEMIYISPLEQGIDGIGFFRNNRENITVNYLTLIVSNKGTGLSSLRIDGRPVTALTASECYTYPHPRMRDFTVVVRRWANFPVYPNNPPGQCLVHSDSAFTAITYGLGNGESYGYNAGTHINNLDGSSYLHNTLNTISDRNAFTCLRTPVTISALLAYKPTRIQWRLSELAGIITPSADVTDNAPVLAQTLVINGGTFYKYTLAGIYSFNEANTFYLPVVFTSAGVEKCDHIEELKLKIQVKPEPVADFSFARNSECSLDKVNVSTLANTSDGYTLQSWNWRFPDATTATGMNASHILAAGADQPITLSTVTVEGCIADTMKKITVYAPPVADFNATTAAACEKGSYAFTGTATYNGSSSLQWYWDFGNGVTQTTTTNSTPPTIYNEAGEHTVKLVVKASDLCISDTVRKPVIVYARPQVDISFPKGCLPQDGTVVFTNNSTVPDKQAITSHQWNFGDASATPANPNTSILASPTHHYQSFGAYNITYHVVSEKGCVKDTIIKTSFNAAPVFSFETLVPVCENTAAFSVAKASVTNGVPGTGIYRGPGTTTAGMFTPSQAGAGTSTIKYVYTAESGCIDSVPQTIQVYPAPVASYTFVNNTCAGTNTTFTSTATVSSGDVISKWNWDFGDGSPVVNNITGSPFGRTYATNGSYKATLVVTTSHNCVSAAFPQTVIVQPLPVADFSVPDAICLPGGSASFTNKSKIAGNGTLNYNWNFGDGSGSSIEANPSHVYAARDAYNVVLTATSAFGCHNEATRTTDKDKFYDRPVAAFTAGAQEICQGARVAFTDGSTAAGSTVNKWSWNFGDGTMSPIQSPAKVFQQAGGFPVALVVENARGCSSLPAGKTITVHRQPVIDAGPSFTVKAGTRVQFAATANASSYKFQWWPVMGLSNAADLSPSLTVTADVMYKLTATGEFNCTASDSLLVKVLRAIEPPNAFTPNGDGVHDFWEIGYLAEYTDAVIDVYNRYGQQVYHTKGYTAPWDGRMNGKDLPSGTYYYIINLGTGGKPMTGPVTIIR